MKKTALLILLIATGSGVILAQNPPAPDLQQMNASAKNSYVPVEVFDKLQQDLKYFNQHPVSGKQQQDLLLDTYRAIANGYAANNHYKQGYLLYQDYLSIKGTFLAAEKAEAIASVNRDLEEKQRKDADELLAMKNEVSQIQLDNENLLSKRKTFKNYFSLIILILTVLFASLLLQTGLKLVKVKRDLKNGRERLQAIHRVATLGKLRTGIGFTITSLFAVLKNLTTDSSRQIEELNRLSGEKNAEQVNLLKQINNLLRLTDQ